MKIEKEYYYHQTNKISRKFNVINNIWNGTDQCFYFNNLMISKIQHWKQNQRRSPKIKLN